MLRVRQIFINIDEDNLETLRKKLAKKLFVKESSIKSLEIVKKSLDARDKTSIHYVYEVEVSLKNEAQVLKNKFLKDIFKVTKTSYNYKQSGSIPLLKRPIIIGAGPAGLFCAYFLAKYGYKPLIIERGEKLEDRVKTVELFFSKNILNENSNIQFGEGGAGTFSDGKLNTLVKDKEGLVKKVFSTFVLFGAPKEIMYIKNPHIGTDLLRNVIINMREAIIKMGGEFRYSTLCTDITIKNNKIEEITLNNNEKIKTNILILAIGNSSRNTFKMLYNKGLNMTNKPFAIGLRIIHSKEFIDKNQYGKYYKILPSASYKLTYVASTKRGVYSFCMCPGGYVINASSKNGYLVVNGMSNYQRDNSYSNSALVVTITKEDLQDEVFKGMDFQEKLERKAYLLGKGNIPVQRVTDYLINKESTNLLLDRNMLKGDYYGANLRQLFPSFINKSLDEALENFNKKMPGFISQEAILCGVETRTSSPIRIIRDENLESNIKGIYPIGEGSGYSGGITTSAIDGIKAFQKIISTYKVNY